MKVAVVYNRESRNVVNLFGMPNKERIGQKTIRRIVEALRQGGHQVIALEGDKDLVDRLEEFMPRVVKGERPGMVFNVSYGIQGQARYTHVPSILEMVGVPYVASGPLAHSLSLDKVVTKIILRQHGLPTPDFAVLDSPEAPAPALEFPLIVKPKNEAVSFGLRVVHDEEQLRRAAEVIFTEFRQPVLVESYIEGREINVGLLGNNPPEALPPVELIFPDDGPRVYSYEDKTGRSGRSIGHVCPAPIGAELLERARELAVRAFTALGCYDCARVDMRLDDAGKLYILETNSLPSLGEHGSYLVGAAHVGLDFQQVIHRLVEVASARYFGTPQPPRLDEGDSADRPTRVFAFVTQRRDRLERRLKEWTAISSRANDAIGLQEAERRADRTLVDLGLRPVAELGDGRSAWTWATRRGIDGGTLLVAHLDVPIGHDLPTSRFRREPEWLYGEGIGSSRAPLAMIELALRALRGARLLQRLPLAVLLYADEARDARESAAVIRAAASRAQRVLVLRPGNLGDTVITARRGQRVYRLRAEDEPRRPGRRARKPEVLRWVCSTLETLCDLSDARERVSVSSLDVQVERLPLLLPHRVTARLLLTYPGGAVADRVEKEMRERVGGAGAPRWSLERVSDRPEMIERRPSDELARGLKQIAEEWEIPLEPDTSTWPSVAGLVPAPVACVCGLGPVARDLGRPGEAVQRISVVQRTLLLAEYLARLADEAP